MAYMNQEKKKVIAEKIKVILKEYGLKGTLSVRNHSTLVLNITCGEIDFISNYNKIVNKHGFKNETNYMGINPYHYMQHFDGLALECMKKIMDAMNTNNHDNSDIQSDYFDVGHYVDVNIGTWEKPYVLAAKNGESYNRPS